MDENQKKQVMIGVAALIFIVSGFLMFRGGPETPDPSEYSIDGVCVACKETVQTTASLDEPPPARCPHCGEKAAFTWLYCYECNKRFIPNLELRNDQVRLPIMPTCRACGSANVGAYIEEDPAQEPVGDAELPPLPG